MASPGPNHEEGETMQRESPLRAVEELLKGAGRAHHEAFAAVDGEDPEWAIWYSDHLRASLPDTLGVPLTRTQIVCLLASLADEHSAQTSPEPWPRFYADQLVERFVPEPEEELILYVSGGCPFCMRVQAAVKRLGVNVEERDVHQDPAARRELIEARGRATVPVLRCISGELDRWMPESADIVRFLEHRFGVDTPVA